MKRDALALPAESRLHGLSPAAIRDVVAAAQALELGRAAEAERYVIGLLARYPAHPEVLRLAAGIHTLRGEYMQAIAAMESALVARPDDALYHNTLGAALIETHDYDRAIATLERACALDAKLPSAWFNLGLALMRCMRVAESADTLRHTVALVPDHATARVILADMLRAQGHDPEAIAEYRRVLAREPRAGMAWWGLADIKTHKLGADEIAQMRAVLAQRGIAESDRVAIGLALAKALDDQGDYAASLNALGEAHARARAQRVWQATAHSAAVERVLAAFSSPPATTDAALGAEVIFVASLPRSGSTLIEQILAAHSQVEGAGELPDLPAVLTEESRRRGQAFPQWVATTRAEDWARLGRRYLERTRHWRTQRPRFVDKLPYNWFYVGAIRAMLPAARIVLVRRDPLETCFSCYRQHLAGNDYTHSFADLAQFQRDFERAAAHWIALHPTHVRAQSYEELTTDPDRTIRALLAFCDLPFEAQCLAPHETRRDVHTPSATQVRQPLRRDTERAPRYGALLDPLRAALALPPFTTTAG
jgi:tetratricopeptide (TPR) repeat protein